MRPRQYVENEEANRRAGWLLCLKEVIGPPIYSIEDELKSLGDKPGELEHINLRSDEVLVLTECKKAGLTLDEIRCYYIYENERMRAYVKINEWLRGFKTKSSKPSLYSTITVNLYNCLVKLSRYQDINPVTLYRGLSVKIQSNHSFLSADLYGFKGDIDYGLISCTSNFSIAYEFCKNFTYPTFMEINEDEEDEGGIHCGVRIPKWLANYVEEEEVIFPPLTVLHVKEICDYPRHNMMRIIVKPLFRPQVDLPLLSPDKTIWDAVKNNNLEVVRLWLESHPSVNLEEPHKDYGCCLLYSAARFGSLPIVQALYRGCAYIDSQVSKERSTPLHAASYCGHIDVVSFLLEQGANPHIKNNYGYIPLDEVNIKREDIKSLLSNTPFSTVNIDNDSGKLQTSYLVYGDRLSYLRGINKILGSGVMTMEQEFQRGIIFEEYYSGKNNTKQLWNEAVNKLKTLKDHPSAVSLTDDEILACYLYTTAAYKPINEFLRTILQSKTPVQFLTKEKTWVSTVYNINSAIRKLSTRTKKFPISYRGVSMSLPPDFFVPDSSGIIAATEYGFMSTSESLSKALEFSKGKKHATIFVVKCRKEDPGGYHMGASLEWCTAAKGEKEILFPPLTLFEILKRERITEEGTTTTTITVSPVYV